MEEFKSGFVTLVGRTNVGKSTLLNSLAKEKVAITANKVQTTRTAIKGIVNREDAQIIFTDTPGIHKPKNKLGEKMAETINDSMTDVDVILYLIEGTDKGIGLANEFILNKVIEQTPDFFEHLVVDLIVAMGYGGSVEDAGRATKRTNDEGIDGLVKEDKLGLDLIYVQAKRYSNRNTVGRKELQAFIGAMEHIKKGVFITTSSFTKEAIKFIEKQQQKILGLSMGDF